MSGKSVQWGWGLAAFWLVAATVNGAETRTAGPDSSGRPQSAALTAAMKQSGDAVRTASVAELLPALLSDYDYRTPVIPSVCVPDSKPHAEPPSQSTILRALPRLASGSAGTCREYRDDMNFVVERLGEHVDSPRCYPLIGTAQLHHSQWKCTVYYNLTTECTYPFTCQVKRPVVSVVYLDRDCLDLCRVAEPESDLAYVPCDAAGFFTIHVAAIAARAGLKERTDWGSWATGWQQLFGVPIELVERFTVVDLKGDGNTTCAILRTTRPYDRDQVLKAFEHGSKTVKFHGKVFHVDSEDGSAVHFVNDCVLLMGDQKKALSLCLKQKEKGESGSKLFTEALEKTEHHDIVFWSRVVPQEGDQKDKTAVLAFLQAMPMPTGIEAVTAFVDFGDQLAVDLRLSCTDAAGARRATRMLRAVVKLAQGELRCLAGMADLAEVMPGSVGEDCLPHLPAKLFHEADKGFQHMQVRTDGCCAVASVSIALDARTLCAQLKSLESADCCLTQRLMVKEGYPVAPTLPSGQYLDRPPQYFPADPDYPVFSEPTNLDPTASAILQAGYTVGKTSSGLAPGRSALSFCMSGATACMTGLNCTGGTLKLTVANVRKEEALLFTITDEGKLTFAQKLAPGEAVDVSAMHGQRWVAVFTDRPAGETFTPTQADGVWLLR